MKTALIVDDSVYNRTLLGAILRKKGLRIEMAEDGEEAIQKFKECHPDIVFLDYLMPKKNGIEALIEMKKLNQNFIGIMLTAVSNVEDVNSAKGAGASGYLLKPMDTQKIYELLKKFNIAD